MLLQLLREFVAFSRWRIALAFGVMACLGVSEGAGLLLLVELLGLVGLDVGAGTLGPAGRAVRGALDAAGFAASLPLVLLLYVGITAARGSLERYQTVANQRLQFDFVTLLRGRLYSAITRANWEFHSTSRTADFMHALTEETRRVGSAAYHLLQIAVGSTIAAVYLAFALWMTPLMTAVVLVCGGMILAVIRRSSTTARKRGEELSSATEGLYRTMAEQLGSIKTAKSYGWEDRHVQEFGRLSSDVAGAWLNVVELNARLRQHLELVSVILLGALVYTAHTVVGVPIGRTLLLLFLFTRLVPRLNSLFGQAATLSGVLPSFANVAALEDRTRRAAEDLSLQVAACPSLSSAIRLDHVTFSYKDRTAPAVADVSLTIAAGKTTAIVGPSGAGKTTVADLVMGLLRPHQGSIAVDGRPLEAPVLRAWRAQVGYVAQETFLFHDTVRANLAWAAPHATEPEMWRALEMAAAGFVRALPKGLDTVVGDRGVLLSGGERQRLALARALLRRPALVILDEATSALDSENEARIQSAIEGLSGRMTILIITHRLSTVRRADVLYVMENGSVIETGTWARLAHGRTRFRELCELQRIDVHAAEAHLG